VNVAPLNILLLDVLWFASSDAIYAVGRDGRLRLLTAADRSQGTDEGVPAGSAMWGSSAGELFMVGAGGAIYRKRP